MFHVVIEAYETLLPVWPSVFHSCVSCLERQLFSSPNQEELRFVTYLRMAFCQCWESLRGRTYTSTKINKLVH